MGDFLTAEEIEQIKSDVAGLTQDEDIASDILYRHLTSSVFDPITGKNAEYYDEYIFKACGGTYSLFEIARSNGLLAVGDKMFTFVSSNINNLMSVGDRLYVKVTDAGDVNLQNGSKEIEGIDTTFKSSGVQPGDVIGVNGVYNVIGSITEEDEGQLKDVWADESYVETGYAIYRQYSIIQLIQDLLGISVRVSVRRSGG